MAWHDINDCAVTRIARIIILLARIAHHSAAQRGGISRASRRMTASAAARGASARHHAHIARTQTLKQFRGD
jgi:hypothetical protein